jgi:hypothetical protein
VCRAKDKGLGFNVHQSLRNSLLLVVGVLLFSTLVGGASGRASTFGRAIEHCRDTVGRPIVQSCLYAQGKGAALEACRETAGPKVRACIQKIMIATKGGADIQETGEHCRQTAGRPIFQRCMSDRGLGADLRACQTGATPPVRTCVRRSLIATYGQAKVEGMIEHCRQTVGRPLVQGCMGGARAAVDGVSSAPDRETCRAKAAPQVRACVRRAFSAGP